MPKFYVQSGNVELVTTAIHTRGAAIWAAHRTLSQSLPFLCDEATDVLALNDLTRLGETIRVSEQGFDREDAVEFDTLDIVGEWNRLLVAIDRIHERLEGNAECGVRNAE
jgi:hypothetical protein